MRVSLVLHAYIMFLSCSNHLSSGSMKHKKISGDSVSPWMLPLPNGISPVSPAGVMKAVLAPVYKFPTMLTQSDGKPKSSSSAIIRGWSTVKR